MARTPPRWLRPGDVVSIEIEGIGKLANPVANEQLFGGKSPHSKQHDNLTR